MSIQPTILRRFCCEKNRFFVFLFSLHSPSLSRCIHHFIWLMYYVHSFATLNQTQLYDWCSVRVNCTLIGFVFGWKTKKKILNPITLTSIWKFRRTVLVHTVASLMRDVCGCGCSTLRLKKSIQRIRCHIHNYLHSSHVLMCINIDKLGEMRSHYANSAYWIHTNSIDIARFYCSVIVILIRFDCIRNEYAT